MTEVDDFDQLVAHLRTRLEEADRLVVGVDGACGAGKTTLADGLGKALGAEVIHVDDHLDKGKAAYRQAVRYRHLGRDIEKLSRQVQVLIVEGMCLLEVLEEAGIRADVYVYVQRLRRDGSWADELVCDATLDHDWMVKLVDDSVAMWRKQGGHEASAEEPIGAILDRETIDYHFCHRPKDKATYVYKWTRPSF